MDVGFFRRELVNGEKRERRQREEGGEGEKTVGGLPPSDPSALYTPYTIHHRFGESISKD